MIPLYAKNGFTVFVCPHAKIPTTAEGNSSLKHGVLYCDQEIVKKHRNDIVINLARIQKIVDRLQKKAIAK